LSQSQIYRVFGTRISDSQSECENQLLTKSGLATQFAPQGANCMGFPKRKRERTMTTTLKRRVDEPPAEAFLNTAQQYHLAATTLLPLYQQAESPLYFLFTHVIELALKAYLRSHGLSPPRRQEGHALQKLFEQCQRKGL
jgi:hypothetical protein